MGDDLNNNEKKEGFFKKSLTFFGRNENKDNKKKKNNKDIENELKNFDIKKFREEYTLKEEEFPDDILKQKFMKYKGNKIEMFLSLVNQSK